MRPSHVSLRRSGAVIAVLIMLVAAGCGSSDSDADAPTTTAASADPAPGAGAGETSAGCENVHAGHSAMMWNPTMADEMLDADCGWPYEPFMVDLEGGTDDDALTAPFVATRYEDLWTAISASGVGVCSVGTELEGDEVGRAFGFTYLLGPPGCPDATPTGALHVAEFGTEAQRDSAANASAEAGTDTFVLGRWVVTTEGETGTASSGLLELGAQQVS